MRRLTRNTAIALALGLGLTIGFVWLLGTDSLPVARASTYTVTSTDASGPGSLRQAILDANANVGHDTIDFAPSVSGTIVLTDTLPQIDDDLTITGPGPDALSISGDNAYRVLEIASSTAVTISNLTIRDGSASTGGGIWSAGTLLLTATDVVSSTATSYGGGVYILSGSTTLSGGQIISNTAGTSGGGVFISSGSATLSGGQIISNTATLNGGGVYVDQSSAVFTQTGVSTITQNHAGWHGGGVYIWEGQVFLEGGEIINNTADGHGGGVNLVRPSSSMVQTGGNTIAHNTADDGGGIYVQFGSAMLSGGQILSNTATWGGGVYVDQGSATVTEGQILNNTANTNGGGIYINDGTVALTNTTVSGNRAIAGSGGGLYTSGGTITITFTTIASNTAASSGYGIHRAGGAILLQNTIVAHNGTTATNCSGVLTSNGHNLEYGDTCSFTATTDLTDTNPLLGPLTYEGGTWVYPLLQGSPAIDAGACVAGIARDQRGVTRLAPCDIGAYEWGRSVYLPLVLRNY
jgi:hypothetical protein